MNQAEKNIIRFLLVTYENPYPKDIFRWDNTEKLDFNRRRFNQHCYAIVKTLNKGDMMEKRTIWNDRDKFELWVNFVLPMIIVILLCLFLLIP